jgi:septum formation protein
VSAPRPRVVLASTSPYRRALLQRLLGDFECRAPGVDESPRPGETPRALATRLAQRKAESAAEAGDIVIGSDQVAALGDRLLEKPGTLERAISQLDACSARAVAFHTAVCVISQSAGVVKNHVDLTTVHFRQLSPTEIRRYLERDKPFDCAGSFKAEGLGVALMDRIDNHDPTAIQGLPLIWLASCLREMGLPLP